MYTTTTSGRYYATDDIWSSSDGTTWTRVNSNPPWNAGEVSAAVYNNKMWVLTEFGNLYSSSDGVTWATEGGVPNSPSLYNAGLEVLNNDLIAFGVDNSLGVWRRLPFSFKRDSEAALLGTAVGASVGTTFLRPASPAEFDTLLDGGQNGDYFEEPGGTRWTFTAGSSFLANRWTRAGGGFLFPASLTSGGTIWIASPTIGNRTFGTVNFYRQNS